jgi:hypothetical protein
LDNYFYGSHDSLCFQGERGCDISSKYSEKIYINGTKKQVFTVNTGTLDSVPLEIAFFDKKFFLPIIKSAYEESDLQFSQNNFNATITILNEKEIKDANMDYLYGTEFGLKFYTNEVANLKKADPIIKKETEGISISTLDSANYGKHIFAPKDELIESQYLDVKLAKKMPKDKDFGIEYRRRENSTVISPLTSPIDSIVTYWKYVLIDNKITLVYDKTVATLDTGKTKILAQNDELVESTPTLPATSTSAISSTTSTVTDTQQTIENPPLPPENRTEGFFSKFIKIIASWFKF